MPLKEMERAQWKCQYISDLSDFGDPDNELYSGEENNVEVWATLGETGAADTLDDADGTLELAKFTYDDT